MSFLESTCECTLGGQFVTMSENARQLAPLVITLKSMKPKQRREVVKAMNRHHFRGLTEVAVNMIKNTVKLSPDEMRVCRRWRKPLKLLALKRYPTKEKRNILQRGGFLGAILPILASVLGAVING